jgi:hypothetical protein
MTQLCARGQPAALPYLELPALMGKRAGVAAGALEFVILTATQTFNATWDESWTCLVELESSSEGKRSI